jgi:hypothetical protein
MRGARGTLATFAQPEGAMNPGDAGYPAALQVYDNANPANLDWILFRVGFAPARLLVRRAIAQRALVVVAQRQP